MRYTLYIYIYTYTRCRGTESSYFFSTSIGNNEDLFTCLKNEQKYCNNITIKSDKQVNKQATTTLQGQMYIKYTNNNNVNNMIT